MSSFSSSLLRKTRRRQFVGTSLFILLIVTFYDTSVLMSGLSKFHGRFLQELGDEPKIPSPLESYPYGPWDSRVNENLMDRKLKHDSGEDDENLAFTKRPLSFLTLGGSITWGGAIQHRYDAFPYLLQQLHPENQVDNRALRATGAHFPAACIQSLVEGDAFPEWEFTPGDVNREPKEYDVILLEFSVNGFAHTDFLIRRLRKRYPKAVIVYVHLHSLTNPPPAHMEEDGFFDKFMGPVNGYHWKIDVPPPSDNEQEQEYSEEFLKLYNEDKHHLSEVGHKHVAEELMKLLDQVGPTATASEGSQDGKDDQLVGSWGAGDQCYMWLGTWGHFPTSLSANGGEFKIFDKSKKKYAYEIQHGQKATFAFERQIGLDEDGVGMELPIHLVTMIKGDPPKYPKLLVTLHPDKEEQTSTFTIDPREDELFKSGWSWAHLTSPTKVGMSLHGWNVLNVEPLEESTLPARIVGIMICGECETFAGAHNVPDQMRARIPDSNIQEDHLKFF